MFWHKKKLQSEEFEQLNNRMISLNADFQKIKAEMSAMDSMMRSLRGLVNRKIHPENENRDKIEEPTSLNGELAFG